MDENQTSVEESKTQLISLLMNLHCFISSVLGRENVMWDMHFDRIWNYFNISS